VTLRQEASYRARDSQCRKTCGVPAHGDSDDGDAINCLRRCVSAACYASVYGSDPVRQRYPARSGAPTATADRGTLGAAVVRRSRTARSIRA
jgi:hypothetical protein